LPIEDIQKSLAEKKANLEIVTKIKEYAKGKCKKVKVGLKE
jgi:hypothetical protein